MFTLDGRNVVIVGGGSGLGLAAAGLAVRLGARVVAADINSNAAAPLESLGPAVYFVQCDARDPAQTARLFATAAQRLGSVDCVFTTVGGASLGPLDSLDLAAWNAELEFNLTTTYIVSRAAVAPLRSRGGVIVTTSSGYAMMPGPDRIAYTAAKAGVIALTRSLAASLAPLRIRVNCIAPGPIDTPRFRAMNGGDAGVELVRQKMPLGTIPTPQDVANAAMFLMSDAAAQITGQIIHVNGGVLMP